MVSKKKTGITVLIAVLLCGIMAIVDGFFRADYLLKSVIKVILFTGIPVLYSFYDKEVNLKSLLKPQKSGFFRFLGLGVAVYAVILCGYFALRGVFDFSGVADSLTQNIGVNKDNFVFVALYISFANSLLEEFFFRGFVFMTLIKTASLKFAYILSSGLFAVYHIAMMSGWFSPIVFCVVLPGLFAGGMIFNFLNSRSGNIYPSWLVHMFANFAINTIGFILFDII